MEPNNNDRLLEQFKTINSDYNKIIKKNELNDFNWNEKIKNIKKDNEKFKKDNELLKKENEDKNKEINELKNKLNDNELLKKENEDKNKEINELKNKLKENELLKKENENKNKEINELKNKFKENESSKKFKKENESLKKEKEKFKKDNESLKKENEKFKKDNESLKKENEKFKKENESLKKENEDKNNLGEELINNLIKKFFEKEKNKLFNNNIQSVNKQEIEKENKNKNNDNENKNNNNSLSKMENKNENKLNFKSFKIPDYQNFLLDENKIENHFIDNFKPKENEKGLTIGFLGDLSVGKTFLINKIFDIDLLLVPTNSIYYYFIKDNIRVIDTPGLNNIMGISKQNKKEKLINFKFKDFMTEKFVLDNSLITIFVINSYNYYERKKIEIIKKTLNENYKEIPTVRTLIVIHNIFQIKSTNDYNEYIKNNFPYEDFYNKDNLIFTEKIDETDKFEVLHFVLETYDKNNKVIESIKNHIFQKFYNDLIDFNKMIENSFQNIGEKIYGLKDSVMCVNKNNSIQIFDSKNSTINNNQNFTKEYSFFFYNSKNWWNNFKYVTPHYSCYINSENDLVIEIELVGFKNCKLSYEIINNEFYNFHIIAEKENDEIEKKMIIQNKRFNENIDYIIKIPIDSFTLSESKPYFKKSEKGLITFKYKLLNNSSSISIKFNDINIPK